MTFFRDVCLHFAKSCRQDLGFYGKDAPEKLIEFVLKSIKQRESKVDAIIINGDFVGHGVAASNSSADFNETWSAIKKIMSKDIEMVREQFGDAAILPSIGNNDVVYHNQVPCDSKIAN